MSTIPLPENVSEISPRIKLKDGRHLAYKELGVPKDKAENKIIIIHGYGNSKDVDLYITQEMIDKFKIYFLLFDRAGYGESDLHPSRTLKTDIYDIEELVDKLQIGPKFHVIGMSLEAYPVYGCLKYILHRLSGATLVVPLVNFWWSNVPKHLLNAAIMKLPNIGFRVTLRIAHYFPWLIIWWMTQKWFPCNRNSKDTMTKRDLELAEEHTKHPSIKATRLTAQQPNNPIKTDLTTTRKIKDHIYYIIRERDVFSGGHVARKSYSLNPISIYNNKKPLQPKSIHISWFLKWGSKEFNNQI